jgi:hypothetical protein
MSSLLSKYAWHGGDWIPIVTLHILRVTGDAVLFCGSYIHHSRFPEVIKPSHSVYFAFDGSEESSSVPWLEAQWTECIRTFELRFPELYWVRLVSRPRLFVESQQQERCGPEKHGLAKHKVASRLEDHIKVPLCVFAHPIGHKNHYSGSRARIETISPSV